MYVPAHFAMSDTDAAAVVDERGAGLLVVVGAEGLRTTFLPVIYDRSTASLRGHVARANPLWRDADGCPALMAFTAADAYVSPSWYATKAETGRVVPTWNYVHVEAHGHLVVHDDDAWVASIVRRLTERHEGRRPAPWSVEDAPIDYIEAARRGIVGVELVVTALEGKAKLSQNRSSADRDGVRRGLAHGTERDREVGARMNADEGAPDPS